MPMDTWQNGSAMWACEKRGVRRAAVVTGWEGGRTLGSRTGAKENRQRADVRRHCRRGIEPIGFHEGTEEADRIQGARNGRKAGAGRWRSGAGISARCPYSGNGGMAEWQECWVVRRKSRLMRGESAAGVQPVPR